jgi:hypothetical protein
MRPLYKFRRIQEDNITFYNLKECERGLFATEEFIYSFEDAEIFVVKFCTTEVQCEKRYNTAFRCIE